MGSLRNFTIGVLVAWPWATSSTPWAPPVVEPPPPPPAPAVAYHAIHAIPTQAPAKRKPRRKARRLAPRLVAVREALRQRGIWYRWGGTSPRTGFDCSGLVQYAWRKAGVRLPRVTYDMIRSGRAVANIRRVRPGDLLFPSRGHVQMAVGGGRVVEAARTGTRVRVRPLRAHYLAIRRPAM